MVIAGGVKRKSGEERITFLSKIRTLAIQPLQEVRAQANHMLQGACSTVKHIFSKVGSAFSHTRSNTVLHITHHAAYVVYCCMQDAHGSPPEWQADRLLFMNDVYFCAKDILRLLQHRDAALACGMDFNEVGPTELVL